MGKIQPPYEAEIVQEVPSDIARHIGNCMVAYSKLEHRLTKLTGLLLQLNRPEARIALRMPRAVDRLDMALDIFAIKKIDVPINENEMRGLVTKATSGRDSLAHGLVLKHPENNDYYLQQTRRNWPKDLTKGETVKRAIFPQSIPLTEDYCKSVVSDITGALDAVETLGLHVDTALEAFPERFRKPLPVHNPLGTRNQQGN